MISVKNLSLRQGGFVLRDVTFDIPTGCFAALMGKTGSGKTSILEAICGLRSIESGTINLCGRDVTRLRPSERGVGYVPQDGVLFDHMTVKDQLSFALKIRRWEKESIEKRVDELAQLLEIGDLLDRKPFGLSGGEIQRVSLGRALSFEPKILLLDEPLSALDDETREQMYQVIRRVRKFADITALHVTHNRAEANELGDVILVIRDGKIGEHTEA